MATKPRISRSVVSTRTTKSAATKATTPSSSAGKSSPAQRAAAQKNIKKAQAKWKSMTHRQHALAQPQGKDRKKPGTTGKGAYYHIEVRPSSGFTSFRTQDVGHPGGLERVAGRRSSGSRATVARLVSKELAHMSSDKHLVIDDPDAQSLMKNIRGPILHLKGDIFTAHPRKNIAEKDKPTTAMKKAQRENIKKAQAARKKKATTKKYLAKK